MRQTVLSALTWIVVTVLATSIGLVAVSTVGEVLRGSGPLGEDFSIAERAQDGPSVPTTIRERVHSHPAATLIARCDGYTATLLSVQAAPGVTVTDTDLGPDEDVHAEVLDSNGIEIRLESYCNRGEPTLIAERLSVAGQR